MFTSGLNKWARPGCLKESGFPSFLPGNHQLDDNLENHQASLVAQLKKNLPAMQETQVQSLGWEDLLEKKMATHSTILPGKFHTQRSLVCCSPWGCKELDRTERQNTFTFISWKDQI